MSGHEARARVRSKALESGDYLKRRSEDLKESAVDLVGRGKTAVSRQREQLNAAVEAGRQAYRETIAEASAGVPNAPAPNPEGV
jgi:hypothetical protein